MDKNNNKSEKIHSDSQSLPVNEQTNKQINKSKNDNNENTENVKKR